MSDSIHALLEALPQANLTTRLLGALDWVVPGEWKNITVFDELIEDVTGEADPSLIQQIGERAIALYADTEQGYQRAVAVYQGVDHTSTAAGLTVVATMLNDRFSLVESLKDITPKPDTVQAVDAGVKLAAELIAFCLTNGLPGDSVSDFASAVINYGKEERIRMTAWLAFDCLIPLGPDFLGKMLDGFGGLDLDSLQNHRVFRFVADHLPGDLAQKKALVETNLQNVGKHLENFGNEKGLTRENLLERVREYVDVADDKLDVVAAALDLGTNTFEHTGIQTVARKIVSRAYGEI